MGNVSISLIVVQLEVLGDSSAHQMASPTSSGSRSVFVCFPPCQLPSLPTACTSVSEQQLMKYVTYYVLVGAFVVENSGEWLSLRTLCQLRLMVGAFIVS